MTAEDVLLAMIELAEEGDVEGAKKLASMLKGDDEEDEE